MALITCQGFDANTAVDDYFDGWTGSGPGGSLSAGRRGGGALSFALSSGTAYYNIGSGKTTLVLGVAIYCSSIANKDIIKFIDDSAATAQLVIELQLDGSLDILRNLTLLDSTAAGVITAATWHYIELKATIDSTVGAYELRVDEVNVMSGTGANTQASANNTVDQVKLSYVANLSYYDDFYLLDTTGTTNNDFLGDVMVQTLRVTANGTTNVWTPLSGANYTMVDETTIDSDTTYVSTGTAGNIDLYTMGNLSDLAGGTVLAVLVSSAVRHDASTQTARNVIRTGGSNFEGADIAVPAGYKHYPTIWETNPDTLAAWTETDVNGLEAGIKLQAI